MSIFVGIPMKYLFFYSILVFSFFFNRKELHAQVFDESQAFIHFRRSFSSNFLTGEIQLGNEEEMNFLSVRAGINFATYNSFENCPYYLTIPEPKNVHDFYKYSSKRKGVNAGVGGIHYFKSFNNTDEFIPYLGLEANWYLDNDYYHIQFENITTAEKFGYNDRKSFHSLSADLQAGVIFIYKKIFFNGSFLLSYFLPVNSNSYLASDHYNIRSGPALPLVGFEPACQLGIGLNLVK